MQIRYIADMHFDHADIIPYDDRPFDSADRMNQVMIERWNQVVGPDDLTWILGDFCSGPAERWAEILDQLAGRKALILGNHDPVESARKMADRLEDIADYREIEDKGRKVILCHYPILSFRDHYFGAYHLYGHVHSSYEWNITKNAKRLMRELYVRDDILRMANTGAMLPYMDYTPRTLDELKGEL